MSIKITWYGHAAISLKTGDYNILIDPYFTNNPAASIRADKVEPDFILVSHGHNDHLGDTVEIAKRTNALVISNAEIATWLEARGVRTHGQHIGGGYHHPFGYLQLTMAVHGSGMPDGSDGGNPAGFQITTLQDEKVYFAGDTGLFSDMRLISGDALDLAILPIGDNYTMGPGDALQAVILLQPKHVLPIHYNTWDLIKQDVDAWAVQVQQVTRAKVHVLKPGEDFLL